MIRPLIILFIFFTTLIYSQTAQEYYYKIDTQSVKQLLAFYEIYPDTDEGKLALKRAWKLLSNENRSAPKNLSKLFFALTNNKTSLEEEDLVLIEHLGNKLANRQLKGYYAQSEDEVLSLDPEEIDIAKGLLLSYYKDDYAIRYYEATLDLMALQILAKLPKNANASDKIDAINAFIFQEMHYRFPPHSKWVDDIDLYTFLPSVIDSHRGVCLGVSTLYMCLAQRLNLNLEMITPPGHIYIRYKDAQQVINIETTARGINIPSKDYYGINTHTLQKRDAKEVIGLTFYNEASSLWGREEYPQAIKSYERALKYLPNDPLVKEHLAYVLLIAGHRESAVGLLDKLPDTDYAVTPEPTRLDYLNGNTDVEGLKALFLRVDETQESLINKRNALINATTKHPKFRAGWIHLATTWLQLGREREAIISLEKYHQLDPNSVSCEYYLAILQLNRRNFPAAWKHLHQAEKLSKKKHYNPEPLRELRRELIRYAPE